VSDTLQLQKMNRVVFACALASTSAACMPVLPVSMAAVTYIDHFEQHFLTEKTSGAETQDIYQFLVGDDATKLLPSIHPAAAHQAEYGNIVARGSFILTARLDPFDVGSYILEGVGRFSVFTMGPPPEESLFAAELDIGNVDQHRIDDLQNLQIVLPIRQHARIDPAILLGHAKESAGNCVIDVPKIGDLPATSVKCTAAGVGTPYRTEDYYVRIRLKAIAPLVYAIDRRALHDVFRLEAGYPKVFGCLKLADSNDASKQLDLRSKDSLRPQPRPPGEGGPLAYYDRWVVPEACPNPAVSSATGQ
jgi:hypothetical protein